MWHCGIAFAVSGNGASVWLWGKRRERREVRHKKRSHESFKENSTRGLKPLSVWEDCRERERERKREKEKSGGKLWDDYVTVSQN